MKAHELYLCAKCKGFYVDCYDLLAVLVPWQKQECDNCKKKRFVTLYNVRPVRRRVV